MAARRSATTKIPKPKFKLGQHVCDRDPTVKRTGEISFIGEYDAFAGGFRYKVLEANGTRHWWNERPLKRCRKPARKSR